MSPGPRPCDPFAPPEQIVFSARELAFERSVITAILRSLDIDQILYVVLTGVTAGEGLGFNRGLFLLADEGQRYLRTSMAIGPMTVDEAHQIWEDMLAKDLTLNAVLSDYDALKDDPHAHQLTQRLSYLNLRLSELASLASAAVSPELEGRAPIEPMLAQCLLERRPLRSTTLELVCQGPELQEPFCFRNWWMIPLLTPEHVVGMLLVDDAFSRRTVSAGERHLLVELANLSAIAVEKGRLFNKMRAFAEADGLTGLANRRTYDAEIARLLTVARQTGRTLSLIVADIDHFKDYNDRFGHLAGDDVLRFVAKVFRSHARKTDIIARYGGEEFAILLPETSLEQATAVAQKLVTAVYQESGEPHTIGKLSICAGVASSQAGALDETSLFEAADQAVYQAKRSGRNRVMVASSAA